jgi:hypothetical protein
MRTRTIYRSVLRLALAGALVLGMLLLGVIREAHASGSEGPLLPNLVATPPDNASIETSDNEGGLSGGKTVPAELLLRFNGYVHNDGKGALDFRGSRSAPAISAPVKKEIEQREKELKIAGKEEEEHKIPKEPQELSEQAEKELATPSMSVSQRLFETNENVPVSNPEGSEEEKRKFNEENEKYLKRQHKDELSRAEIFYVNADGHHHWHLQHVAKYSLWNATKTAEVAPSEKVGFCLEDSEHVEPGVGPKAPAYSDGVAPYRHFCQRYLPYATGVFEGISPGWRDDYSSNLGFQWVDISHVLPGEYWLREDVNPEGKIFEEGSGEKFAYATKPTIVPGFDALPEAVTTGFDEPMTITATSTRWEEPGHPIGEPNYTITSPPQHGELEPISGTDRFVYRPSAGYSGPDSFTFSAFDSNSEFPRNPAVATVSIDVGPAPAPTPTVAISGAPAEMIAGTSVQLSALVTNDSQGVMWNASAGSITSGGLYTAPSEPPVGGTVVITARSSKSAEAQVAIKILPVPPSQSAPAILPAVASSTPSAAAPTAIPPAASTPSAAAPAPSKSSSRSPAVYSPQAMLIGRKLIMTTRASKAGRIRLSAYLGHRLLGTCATKTPANRSFTCRLTLGRRVRLSSRIAVVASLQIGGTVLSSLRPAAPVPEMKMTSAGKPLTHVLGYKGKLSSLQFLCGPSMM